MKQSSTLSPHTSLHTSPLPHLQVDRESYLVPASCFATACCLNCMTMMFERDSQKFKLAFLAGE